MNYKFRNIAFQKKSLVLLEQVREIVASYDVPVTVRQIFYRLVSLGMKPNTRAGYEQTSTLCTSGRYAGVLDWDRIIDDTKGVFEPSTWGTVGDLMRTALDQYQEDRWAESPVHLELWTEKRTLTRLLRTVTDKYDVPLVAGTGVGSASQFWEAFRRFTVRNHRGKEIVIITVSDLDPTGDWLPDNIGERVNEMCAPLGFPVEMRHLSLTLPQVRKHELPRSFKVIAKKASGESYDKLEADKRNVRFLERYGELFQVEVEALDPRELLRIVDDAIKEYYPAESAARIKKREARDVKKMRKIIWPEG